MRVKSYNTIRYDHKPPDQRTNDFGTASMIAKEKGKMEKKKRELERLRGIAK
jgi:hypothetical protein